MNASITNLQGEKLDYAWGVGSLDRKQAGWLVVLGHGVTGNRERPVVADTAAALNRAGFDTLAFSFAGNGNSEGEFREATISKEVGDLGAVLDAAAGDYANLAYIGHSMGGAVGVLRAAQDERIKALVSLAGMVDTKTFAETEFGQETPDEGLMWEEADCPLSSTFMKDLCETVVNVKPATGEFIYRIPWLLIHGTDDDVVLPKDSKNMEELASLEIPMQTVEGTDRDVVVAENDVLKPAIKLVMIDGADHSFNDPKHKKQMTDAVVEWMARQAMIWR